MAILDPYLRYIACPKRPRNWKRLARKSAVSIVSTEPKVANIMLEIADDIDDIPAEVKALGFKKRTQAGKVFTGDCPFDAIRQLEGKPGLKRAEASRALRNELNIALDEAQGVLPTAEPGKFGFEENDPAGRGVIVGVVDTGIDYTHQSFRNPDGSSRILAIWDQGASPRPGEAPPTGFNYGVEYTKQMIDLALATNTPLDHVSHADRAPFHGTHVAGIAAGNGEPVVTTLLKERRYTGVAPRADLIVVANTRSQTNDPGTIGDSADTLDAIAYILGKAKEPWRPVVVNLSLGDNIGPHDGTSLLEVGIANLMTGPGRVLVKSAGNEGNTRHHAEGDLIDGAYHEVRFNVPKGEPEVLIDVWFAGSSQFGVRIKPPNGDWTREFVAPFEVNLLLTDTTVAFVDAQTKDAVNGHHHTFFVLQPTTADTDSGHDMDSVVDDGVWTLRLTGVGRWHAWIQRNSAAGFEQSTNTMTTSIPAASDALICVGSYVSDARFAKEGQGQLSAFSGRGPTRDGRRVPTLVAPGHDVTSAQPGDRFAAMKGTSMAAAMVTGTVARMLELRPESTGAKVRDCLEQTARRDEFTGKLPNNDWGAGKLDIKAACEQIKLKSGSASAQLPTGTGTP
jgi:subtilisin family serine protease